MVVKYTIIQYAFQTLQERSTCTVHTVSTVHCAAMSMHAYMTTLVCSLMTRRVYDRTCTYKSALMSGRGYDRPGIFGIGIYNIGALKMTRRSCDPSPFNEVSADCLIATKLVVKNGPSCRARMQAVKPLRMRRRTRSDGVDTMKLPNTSHTQLARRPRELRTTAVISDCGNQLSCETSVQAKRFRKIFGRASLALIKVAICQMKSMCGCANTHMHESCAQKPPQSARQR